MDVVSLVADKASEIEILKARSKSAQDQH